MMKRVLIWFPCGIGIAAMAACSNLAAYQSGARHAGTARPESVSPAPKKTIKEQTDGRNSAAVAAVALPKRMTPDEDSMQSVHLIGLDGKQLRDLLGEPSEEQERVPGKLWRFRYAKTCILDVLLYPDVQTQTFRSLNYEVTGDDGSDKGKRRCAAQLQSWAGRR